jgi:hypothetical protein
MSSAGKRDRIVERTFPALIWILLLDHLVPSFAVILFDHNIDPAGFVIEIAK